MGMAESKLNVMVELRQEAFEQDVAQSHAGGEPVSL